MKKLTLNSFHADSGAEFVNIEGYTIPANYGNIHSELQAINNSIALLDRSYLGKVLVKGKDSLDLLNRISTNDLQYLTIGNVCDTVFVTPKGRMIDFCRIINIDENEFVLICSFFKTIHLIDWINRFIILEEVELVDVSNMYNWLTILGPSSFSFLSGFSDNEVLEDDDAFWLDFENIHFPALKNKNFNVPAYNLFITNAESKKIFASLVNEIHQCNGSLIGDAAFQIKRIESGMPDWGSEITEEYNPHEARLIKAVSFTKGCYTGQEVIARLDTYDKVQKYLMILDISENFNEKPPLNVFIDDDHIGNLTSYTYNPLTDNLIGLGYIKKMYTIDIDIYVEIETKNKRIPAILRKPPLAD